MKECFTARTLIERLSKIKNQDAVVVISFDEYSSSNIVSVADETVFPPEADGHIGNVLLCLDPKSEIGMVLVPRDSSDMCRSGEV